MRAARSPCSRLTHGEKLLLQEGNEEASPQTGVFATASTPNGELIAAAIGMTESPEYAARKVRTALRSTAAFVEISRGRWQLGRRTTTEPPPLPYDEQQEWLSRAVDFLVKQVDASRAELTPSRAGSGVDAAAG